MYSIPPLFMYITIKTVISKKKIKFLYFFDISMKECTTSGINTNIKIEKYWTIRIAEGFTQVKGVKNNAIAIAR